MSQETEEALARARAAEERATKEAQDQIDVLVKALTAGVLEQAVAIAREASQRQPDVATAIGREGVAALRADVTSAAETLAADVDAHPEMFRWPLPQGGYGTVKENDVRTAVFKAWYGPRVNAVAAAIEKYGFDVRRAGAERAQSLVLPQSLYTRELETTHFKSVADAQNTLGAARLAVEKATAAVDREAVDSLWE